MSGDRGTNEQTAHCPLERACPMYDLFKLAGMQGLWQALYCQGTYQRCERFKASSQGKLVPDHLLPDGKYLQLSKRPPKE